MGIVTDIIKELPLSVILRDKLQVLEKKYEAIEAENEKLKKENKELREKNQHLKRENDNLKTPPSEVHSQVQVPICPNCSTTGRPFYMSPVPKDFVEIENATHECTKCNYKRRIE